MNVLIEQGTLFDSAPPHALAESALSMEKKLKKIEKSDNCCEKFNA